ncbi:MAG: Ig-like domain-containing protein [Polyangiales bacterium]|nr:Ig-like domain-containing protein [Myxococcales bacterium]MCB9657873.1 Ig-like domain-containing protein [Sandaracinaceae bacterium]
MTKKLGLIAVLAALVLAPGCKGSNADPDGMPDVGMSADGGVLDPDMDVVETPDMGDEVDNGQAPTVPTVVSTSPEDEATGVHAEAAIVFEFSEPMDPDTTEAAYVSNELPANMVTFGWDAEFRTLTILPTNDLPYAEGGPDVGALGFAATIGATAESAAGEPMGESASVHFTTLRRITDEATLVAALTGYGSSTGSSASTSVIVGDATTNSGLRGLLTFSVADVPEGVQLEQARFVIDETGRVGNADAGLGQLQAAHVFFGALADGFSAEILAGLPNLLNVTVSPSATPFQRSVDITGFVADDLAQREARGDQTQLRLGYPMLTDGDTSADTVSLDKNSATLTLTWLAP